MTYEKIGAYKKAANLFVKGMVKTGLFQTEEGDLTLTIEKDKENSRVVLTVANDETGMTGIFAADVVTRVFNKVEPALFDPLADQLSRRKGFGKLHVR